MTRRAIAEVSLDASPVEISNSIVPLMETQKSHPRVQRISENPLQIEIWGENGTSILSWGESLRITITQEKVGSRIQAESKAKLATTLFDYGKNKANLESLLSSFKRNKVSAVDKVHIINVIVAAIKQVSLV